MEKNLVVSCKIQYSSILRCRNSITRYLTGEKIYPQNFVYNNVHSGFTHNIQKSGNSSDIHQQENGYFLKIVTYSYSRITLNNKKECTINTHDNTGEFQKKNPE